MQTTMKLSPPWYTIYNQVKETIGKCPNVTVEELETTTSPYTIPIKVKNDPDRAQSLSNILKSIFHLGGVVINVQVFSDGKLLQPIMPDNAEMLAKMVKFALEGNPLFEKVEVRELIPNTPLVVWPIFTKTVIQFYNDDLSDYYQNFNGLTTNVMLDILKLEYGQIYLYPSTSTNG